jgi:hypothetical protein
VAGAAAVTLVGLTAMPSAAVPESAAAGAGWLRLAHLSPDTPKVDVYLTSFERPDKSVVLRGVGYGAVSDYQRAAAGMYTVSMRPAGASPSSSAELSATIKVSAKQSYTVARLGRQVDRAIRVISDDLTPPARGTARARVVQASSLAPVVDVVTANGQTVARGARFGTTTRYAELPARPWRLRVVPGSGNAAPTETTVNASPGAVYTLFVLDRGTSVALIARSDSAGASAVPRGGVDTGLGGPVDPVEGGGSAGTSVLGTLVVAGGVLAIAMVRSRRRRAVRVA